MIVIYSVDCAAATYVWSHGFITIETIEDDTACEMRYAQRTDCLWIVPGTANSEG